MSPHIEIAAGLGTGKTTFARLLKEQGFETVEESHENHPFLEKFYEDPVRYCFETEVTFLMQHYHAIRNVPQQRAGRGVVL